MRPARHQQVQPELPAQGDLSGGPGGDEGDGPAVPEYALLRVKTDEGLAGQAGSPGKPEAGPASDADHGTTCHLPASQDGSAGPGHKVYPYLPGGMAITRPDQVWAADITYVPMAKGSLYLVAIMDWYSRCVAAWRLYNTLDADFCVEALEEALSKGTPEISNTGQGSQFTGDGFTGILERSGVRISMDGKGRYAENIFTGRLWRTVKYEEVYLKAYSGGQEARAGLDACSHSCNNQRPHQALGYRTPAEVFNGDLAPSDERSINGEWTPGRALADPGKMAGLSLNFAPNLSN